MRQVITLNLKRRFELRRINQFWDEFAKLRREDPEACMYWVGDYFPSDQNRLRNVWVRIDKVPNQEEVATMYIGGED